MSLDEWLENSKWNRRAWTYQECLASKRLLFFGEHGHFVKSRLGMKSRTYTEGAAGSAHFFDEEVGLQLVEVIGKKELTHPSDILRASSGILQAVYGTRISFGMPWDEFDTAILWMPTAWDRKPRQSTQIDHFPTWSWASSSSGVKFTSYHYPVYSLAYWARTIANGTATQGPYSWFPIPSSDSPPLLQSCYTEELCVYAALAWLHGCVRCEVPKDLLVDYSKQEYSKRPRKRWSGSPSRYWSDAFQSYEKHRVFEHIDSSSVSDAGCLLVHSQKTAFTLDWRGHTYLDVSEEPKIACNPIVIRSKDYGIAGTIFLDDYTGQKLQALDQNHADFIALSIAGYTNDNSILDMMGARYVFKHFGNLTVSAFYGCPCATEDNKIGESKHVVECPQHPFFHLVDDSLLYPYENEIPPKKHARTMKGPMLIT
jgi:hypothetical protein